MHFQHLPKNRPTPPKIGPQQPKSKQRPHSKNKQKQQQRPERLSMLLPTGPETSPIDTPLLRPSQGINLNRHLTVGGGNVGGAAIEHIAPPYSGPSSSSSGGIMGGPPGGDSQAGKRKKMKKKQQPPPFQQPPHLDKPAFPPAIGKQFQAKKIHISILRTTMYVRGKIYGSKLPIP